MEKRKINPFIQPIECFLGYAQPGKYWDLREQSGGSKFVFALIMSIIVCCITFGIGGYTFANSKGIKGLIQEVPNFSYSDGVLDLDGQIIFTEDETCLVVDTSVNAYHNYASDDGVDASELIEQKFTKEYVTQMILVSATNIVSVKGFGRTYQVQELTFDQLMGEFGIHQFDSQMLKNGVKPFIIKLYLIIGLVVFPFRLGWLYFMPLLWAVVALIVSGIPNKGMNFSEAYWISFYLQSTFVLIKAIIGLFFNMSTLISLIVFGAIFVVMILRIINNPEQQTMNTYPYYQ